MKGKVFYIVDVFAEEKYAGNQLAVFTIFLILLARAPS